MSPCRNGAWAVQPVKTPLYLASFKGHRVNVPVSFVDLVGCCCLQSFYTPFWIRSPRAKSALARHILMFLAFSFSPSVSPRGNLFSFSSSTFLVVWFSDHNTPTLETRTGTSLTLTFLLFVATTLPPPSLYKRLCHYPPGQQQEEHELRKNLESWDRR